MKDFISILAIILSTAGTILTLYVIKLIKTDRTADFSEVAAFLSKEADPTPAMRKKELYDPHNKKIMYRFKIGIALIVVGAILQIAVIVFF